MTLRIYNTLTRQKEEFRPLDPEGRKVRFYNCGPTVYGPFHIGNARNFVVVDVMRRWIEELGYDLTFVQNITDVDDKIIQRAAEEGIAPDALAEKYTALFFEHLDLLGIRRADDHPRATKYIGPMIALVKDLVDKGHAYASDDGSVWFDVRSFDGYGKLSRKNLDDMRQGERVDAEQQKMKKSPLDFCLWKAAKPGEPSWKSPWGEGRPGWHLECSCMSMKTLGTETLDIHSGGTDLTFPHHENEIAQSEASTGKPFVRYWIHNGFLNIDGEKMSKSLGNFKNIDALLQKYDALTLRHFLLSAHYRTELDFTTDNLDAAAKATARYVQTAREAASALGGDPSPDAWRGDEALTRLRDRFASAMDDDFNTAQAFGALFDLVTEVNRRRAAVQKGEGSKTELEGAAALLAWMRGVMGVGPNMEKAEEGLGGEFAEQLMALLIDVRAEARKAKQFAIADTIRDRLGEMGVSLVDKPNGTEWKRG